MREHMGEGALADALLARWMADPDAEYQWARLWARVEVAPEPEPEPLPPKMREIVLHLAAGRLLREVAELMALPYNVVAGMVGHIRRRLGLERGCDSALLVSECGRLGLL